MFKTHHCMCSRKEGINGTCTYCTQPISYFRNPQMHDYEKYPWPETITVLDENCNISGPHGKQREGWPNYITEWLRSELTHTKPKERSMMIMIWDSYCQAAVRWLEMKGLHKNVAKPEKNVNGRDLYNFVWALLGYIDGQPDNVMEWWHEAQHSVRPQFLMTYNQVRQTRISKDEETQSKKAIAKANPRPQSVVRKAPSKGNRGPKKKLKRKKATSEKFR